jgi:soluble lytic murein transglycosylase-like protein
LCDSLARQRTSVAEGERAAAWVDLSLLAAAVLGDARPDLLTFDDPAATAGGGSTPRAQLTAAARARDTAAYQLLSLGYSAREASDVVAGRISKQALDEAQRMLLVGAGREAAADYLDRRYSAAVRLPTMPGTQPDGRASFLSHRFDATIERYASLHRVDAGIVRAIITVESAFDPAARSTAGAVGLMQLMPATARALGVDPSAPEQNIEGGVRYSRSCSGCSAGSSWPWWPTTADRDTRGGTPAERRRCTARDYVRKVLALLSVAR